MQVPLKIPLQLKWRLGPDMPFVMHEPLSVVIQGTVYVGGGWVYVDKDPSTVMEYNTHSRKWDKLPPYRACLFTMTAINNQLVLVGGKECDIKIKALGVWRADSKKWTHPYPDMPTARSGCSAVGYNEWLIVTGGRTGGHVISSVDVMNTDSKQWYAGPPLPMAWVYMNTATVGDTCYFMGGCTAQDVSTIVTATTVVYSVSLPHLLVQLGSHRSGEGDTQIWKKISGLQTSRSTPLSIRGSLFAVGGRKDGGTVSTIHLYQPATGE